jgi:hypothetical protein
LIITSACSVATSGTRKEKACSCMKSLLARAQSGYTRAVILTTVCSVTAIGTRKERPCSTSRVFSIMLSSCCASTSSFRDSLPSTIQHGRGKCFHNLVLFHLITSDVLFYIHLSVLLNHSAQSFHGRSLHSFNVSRVVFV